MRGIFASLIVMLLTLVVLFGSLFVNATQTDIDEEPSNPPEYHIQVVTQNTDEHFWTLFQEGAKEAGNNLNVYVEFVSIAPRDTDILIETVEMAIFSGVDGIAIQPGDVEKTSEVTQKALEAGIPMVNYENDKFLIPNVPVVGSNSYDIGMTAGNMIYPAAGDGITNVAVILDEGSAGGDSQFKNMKVQGIIDAIASFGKINVSEVYTLDSELFEAERLTRSIIEEETDVNVIICTDEKSTPGVAKVLVDNNKVGDIQVIGYGTMPQTLDYIKRGVIYGTVCPDAYEIGYQTIVQLYANISNKAVSDSSNTDLFIIDKNNIDEFQIENKEKQDEN